MRNALSIDLEEYYQVLAFAKEARPEKWGNYVSRVEANTAKCLGMLADANARATFFTLGWVAEKHPGLIREIVQQGHEIACHSHAHRLIYELTPAEFRQDTERAKALLENVSGQAVRGYRAPSFSITDRSLWALEILAELGFTYDSSIFPVPHPNYGMPKARRFPYRIDTQFGPIVEFPMPTLQLGARRSPFGGGAYLRLLPYWFTRWAVGFVNSSEGQPVCVYFHPWELDPGQPPMKGSMTARLRHYIGMRKMERKLTQLLCEFEFCPLGDLIAQTQTAPNPTSACFVAS
jgi:polysaccharide deacetylase family protein (PEP-CTERM system associated)